MTACSPPALDASRTSFNLLGLIGTGRWHRSRVPRVLPEHHAPCAVVSTHGLLRCRCASLGTSRGYHMFRVDVDHRLTPCRHLRATDSCLFAIIRRLPTRLGSTREKVHGSTSAPLLPFPSLPLPLLPCPSLRLPLSPSLRVSLASPSVPVSATIGGIFFFS